MSPIAKRRFRTVECVVAGCVAVGLLFWIFHLVRRDVAIRDRAETIAAGCRPVVVAQATRLVQKHPGLKWSINHIDVLGDIDPDQPMQNTCAVSVTFRVGDKVDKELWTVDAIAGEFLIGSATLANVHVESIQ